MQHANLLMSAHNLWLSFIFACLHAGFVTCYAFYIEQLSWTQITLCEFWGRFHFSVCRLHRPSYVRRLAYIWQQRTDFIAALPHKLFVLHFQNHLLVFSLPILIPASLSFVSSLQFRFFFFLILSLSLYLTLLSSLAPCLLPINNVLCVGNTAHKMKVRTESEREKDKKSCKREKWSNRHKKREIVT